MAGSYLHCNFYFPISVDVVAHVLAQPIGFPSAALKALLDDALRDVMRQNEPSVAFYPDAIWLDAHIAYCSKLTGWQWLALREQVLAGFRQEHWAVEGVSVDVHSIPYLAFAYIDAALAEKMRAELADAQYGLLTLSAQSDKSVHVLLSKEGVTHLGGTSPYLQHPIEQFVFGQSIQLRMQKSENEAVKYAPAYWEQLQQTPSPWADWQAFVRAQHWQAIQGASASQPLFLGQHHFTDGKRAYFVHLSKNEPVVLADCDLATFKEVNDGSFGWYATDATHLWYCGEPLLCAHPLQFAPFAICDSCYTDGRYVYKNGTVLNNGSSSEVLDARNARAIPNDDFGQGFLYENIFFSRYGGSYFVDAATFRALGYGHFVDKDNVCELCGEGLLIDEAIDPASAELIRVGKSTYLKDAKIVCYARGNGLKLKLLKGANARQFNVVAGTSFVSDGKNVWVGGQACKDLDASQLSLVPLNPRFIRFGGDDNKEPEFFRCGDMIYSMRNGYKTLPYTPLADADAASFEILNGYFARDARHIWYGENLVEGANPAGFAWLDEHDHLWTDGQAIYSYGHVYVECPAGAAVTALSQIEYDLVAVADAYFLSGEQIEGWHTNTHHVNAFNCIEDAQYYYSCYSCEGGGVLVWSKQYQALPLACYQRDKGSKRWFLDAPIPTLSEAQAVQQASIMTQEEFDTLLDCLPKDKEYDYFSEEYDTLKVTFTRCRTARSISLDGSVRYSIAWQDAQLLEQIYPVKTVAICQKVRNVLDVILDRTPPISESTLEAILARIGPQDGGVEYALDAQDLSVHAKAILTLQDGSESLRGVWLDVAWQGKIVRMDVYEEDDRLQSSCHEGEMALWGQVNNDGFEASHWTLERRQLFREALADFQRLVPAQRELKNKKSKAFPVLTWLDQKAQKTVALIAPYLSQSEQKTIVEEMRIASTGEGFEDEGESMLATESGYVWQSLLNALMAHGQVAMVNKEDLTDAMDGFQQLAEKMGVTEEYALSDDELGQSQSVFSIAQDCNQWLAQYGYCLVEPSVSLDGDSDDAFWVVIVKTEHLAAINQQLTAISARFVEW